MESTSESKSAKKDEAKNDEMKIYLLEAWYDGENSVDHAAGQTITIRKTIGERLISLGTAEPEA